LETNILQYSWWSSYIQVESPFRKNYAGIGYTYDEDRDAFIPKKPFNSWILNETTCHWEAPVAIPTNRIRRSIDIILGTNQISNLGY
jgi:hypothetical protein